MTQARFELNDYTTRVLDVIKGRFGLKNRNEALNKLAKDHGFEYVEPAANEDVLMELDAIYENHKRRHGKRRMSRVELKRMLEI